MLNEDIQRYNYAQENIQGEIGKKDGNLIGRVQDLNVQSEFLHPKIVSKSERPLPQLRTTDMDPIEALVNIKKVPRGKFSLLQANTILEKHASNPMEHTAESLANEYNLDLQQTFFFLRHYSKMNLEAEMRAPESSAMKEIIAKSEEKKEAYKNFMQNLFVGKR
ncbi:uncharacterized protein LOC127853608 isoform X2 [Dreissena polymorpha]|uniref:uncharacterized protein LOC127853608 isoform X2 n=1 Tax=Dreissena polymorpha TaxID=45954 RepID=UPI0022649253|nr:uncharacterized protein LOC127853608 isoform X2 [Dreissena polymorpha]